MAGLLARYDCSLQDVIRDTVGFPAITPNMILTWTREIAIGMGEIHGRQVLHLDLKPLNVLMERLPTGLWMCVHLRQQAQLVAPCARP